MVSREAVEAIFLEIDERNNAAFRGQPIILVSVIVAWGVTILAA
jgi:hypothetical protein